MSPPDSAPEDWTEQGPPLGLLLAAVVAVVAAALLLFRSGATAHVLGYLLGSVVCVGLVALFVRVDAVRRRSVEVVYVERRWVRRLWAVVLFAGVAVCARHTWLIATLLAVR